jgi:LysM repeat protein
MLQPVCQFPAAVKRRQIYMNLKRFSRFSVVLLLVGVFVLGLTACKLPASKGPETATPAGNGFPVPGETQNMGGIDTNTFATQTAQALLPLVVLPGETQVNPTAAPPMPVVTSVPQAPAPTSAPVVYVQPTQGGLPSSYTLQGGEFPFCIARRFNVNQYELLSLNGLGTNSIVYAGQTLSIPQTGHPFDGTLALHSHPTTYTVRSGDTLNSIACYFGNVSPDMIVQQNNLSSNSVSSGTVLVIP